VVKQFQSVFNKFKLVDWGIWVDVQLKQGWNLSDMETFLKWEGLSDKADYYFETQASPSWVNYRKGMDDWWKAEGEVAEFLAWCIIPVGEIGNAVRYGGKAVPWIARSLSKSGLTFRAAKGLIWAEHLKPVFDPVVDEVTGKVYKVYAELHHAVIPQRWTWVPNFIKNSSFNLKIVNSIEHAVLDPYRKQFLPKWVKGMLEEGKLADYY
jgi:hypothetical protein